MTPPTHAETGCYRETCVCAYCEAHPARANAAITFVEAIDQIRTERDSFRTRYEKAHADCQQMMRTNDEVFARLTKVECERDEARMLARDAQLQAEDRGNSFAAVAAQFSRARAVAQVYVERVDALGLAADDNDPLVMATAAPIGEAQADLYAALGLLERSEFGEVIVKTPAETEST